MPVRNNDDLRVVADDFRDNSWISSAIDWNTIVFPRSELNVDAYAGCIVKYDGKEYKINKYKLKALLEAISDERKKED